MSAYCSMPSGISLIGRRPWLWPPPSFATWSVSWQKLPNGRTFP